MEIVFLKAFGAMAAGDRCVVSLDMARALIEEKIALPVFVKEYRDWFQELTV
jgi:hypothetical protein